MNSRYFVSMQIPVSNIRKSLSEDSASWEVGVTTLDNRHVAYLAHQSLPEYKFIVYNQAQYLLLELEHFFDVIEGDSAVKVFSNSQKENIKAELFSRSGAGIGDISNQVTKILNDRNIEMFPFFNKQQEEIHNVFK